MDIEKTIEKIKRQITIGECEKNIGIPVYISDLKTVLNELEKKDRQIIKIREFLEKEQLELHDYDDSHDLSCEGKGRMYLVDELLEEYFTNKAENVGE